MPLTDRNLEQSEWLQKVEQSLRAIHIIGKKLIAGRVTRRNPGTELLLIAQEAKLIRHCARVCYLNERHSGSTYPSLVDWLLYVNLTSSEVTALLECLRSFAALASVNDKQLLDVCSNLRFSSEGRRRIRKSSYSLRSYVTRWKDEGHEPVRAFSDRDLAWMSFEHIVASEDRRCRIENSADSSASDSGSGAGSNVSQLSLPTTTPPPSPRITMTPAKSISTLSPACTDLLRPRSSKVSVPDCLSTATLLVDGLTRSHSHESNLQYTINAERIAGLTSSRSINDCLSVTSRPSTLSQPSPHLIYGTFSAGTTPKSLKAARAMHSIPHQWHRRKGIGFRSENCHFCQRQLSFFSEYEKCKSCKWKVHPHCKEKIGDSCGLTPAHLKEALKEMFIKDSGKDGWTTSQAPSSQQAFAFDSVDSSSSTNSSTPSTPAFPGLHSTSYPNASSPFLLPSAPPASYRANFDFPEAVPEVPDIIVDAGASDVHRLISSQDSDSTMRSGCTLRPGSSEGTLFIDSTGSNSETRDDLDPQQLNFVLNRDRWSNGTIRIQNSWNDVTIPFNQIEFRQHSLIGRGRFGEVHKAHYYGDVAVKLLNMDHVDEERQLEAFKAEVASFKNTRHDNIVLFMGYSLDQHKLGIVMYYCKGRPLHQLLHEQHEKFGYAQIVYFATQICQGVSYLHTKKIIHKDLRTKNVFIESRNRVVITDFGLFSMKRLGQPRRNHTLIVPQYWLCYLAPELIRNLSEELFQLPFSESSDVFAFGTIWYELITYNFPFKEHPDVVIWQLGSGSTKLSLSATREIKEIAMRCWDVIAENRPSFRELSDMLERLPKKRLNRSPSYPMSRSYESVF